MAKSTGNGEPIIETTPPNPDDPGPVELDESPDDEITRLRRENATLKTELAERDTRPLFTTDIDPAEQRRRQAEYEQAVLMRSEGARQDAIQQANIKAQARRPGGGVRLADTPTSAMAQRDDAPNDPEADHDDLAPFDDHE